VVISGGPVPLGAGDASVLLQVGREADPDPSGKKYADQ
jgi:hypothetical protein